MPDSLSVLVREWSCNVIERSCGGIEALFPHALMDAYTVNEEANKESQRCPTPRPPPLGSSAPVCGTSSKQANQQAPTGNDGGVLESD
eukprot:3024591-Amphidinium_carterae.1